MINSKSRIQFSFLIPCKLQDRGRLKAFIRLKFKKEKKALGLLQIVFCDDNYLLHLNRIFLQHDYYTDILSFLLSGSKEALSAEIYISVDRVKDNAKNLETSFREELHRVIFHGMLHFFGYRDKTTGEIRKMREMEDKYLKGYFNELKK